MMLIPSVISDPEMILETGLEKVEIRGQFKVIQITTLLRLARILIRFFET